MAPTPVPQMVVPLGRSPLREQTVVSSGTLVVTLEAQGHVETRDAEEVVLHSQRAKLNRWGDEERDGRRQVALAQTTPHGPFSTAKREDDEACRRLHGRCG